MLVIYYCVFIKIENNTPQKKQSIQTIFYYCNKLDVCITLKLFFTYSFFYLLFFYLLFFTHSIAKQNIATVVPSYNTTPPKNPLLLSV